MKRSSRIKYIWANILYIYILWKIAILLNLNSKLPPQCHTCSPRWVFLFFDVQWKTCERKNPCTLHNFRWCQANLPFEALFGRFSWVIVLWYSHFYRFHCCELSLVVVCSKQDELYNVNFHIIYDPFTFVTITNEQWETKSNGLQHIAWTRAHTSHKYFYMLCRWTFLWHVYH